MSYYTITIDGPAKGEVVSQRIPVRNLDATEFPADFIASAARNLFIALCDKDAPRGYQGPAA